MNKALSILGVATVAQAGAAVYGNKICVSNMAGFVMKWHQIDMMTAYESSWTDTYPIDQMKCQDMTAIPDIHNGSLVDIEVKAILGSTKKGSSAVVYDDTQNVTITFSCTGTTLNYSCKVNG